GGGIRKSTANVVDPLEMRRAETAAAAASGVAPPSKRVPATAASPPLLAAADGASRDRTNRGCQAGKSQPANDRDPGAGDRSGVEPLLGSRPEQDQQPVGGATG